MGVACELGFGQGLSANMHAAGSVTQWASTDFNPAQAGLAQEFGAWLAQMRSFTDAKFILLPESATTLREQPAPKGKVTLLIVPEGGFSADEAQLARQVGFIPIRLGTRVLRTETAAVAGIAALQTFWGDFN